EGEGLGGEDDLDQAPGEQLLDNRLQQRQHPGVMGGEAVEGGAAEGRQREHLLVLDADARELLVQVGTDRAALGVVGEPQPRAGALLHRRVAAGAGEDEHDRRQQRGVVEQLDDLRAARRPLETPAVLRAAAPAAPAPVRRAVLAGTARTMPAAGALAPAVAAAPRPAGALV